jgi:hypothetical protein
MKRQSSSKSPSTAKKQKIQIPEYHSTPSLLDEAGQRIWPAPADQIGHVRKIIQECAKSDGRTLIVPDKDADGLASGVILYLTLVKLGLAAGNISVHLLNRGNHISDDTERQAMSAVRADYVFVLDQGSRKGPPIVDSKHTGVVIDHHHADEDGFPEGAVAVSACHCPPVATSSLLTYIICSELSTEIKDETLWLCAVGTHGDLGNTLKWEPPFPDMTATFKQYSKKNINAAVSLLNAPRRTSTYDVVSAWSALLQATSPASVLQNPRLLEARAEVNAEVERCTHTPPRFSSDGKVAIFTIASAAQVHPVIATRWAGHLQSSKLEIVMVANEGYLPDKVNFSCRIAKCARANDPPVNIIESLREIAARSEDPDFLGRLGENFARGHKEASGGIVSKEAFEEFVTCLDLVERRKAEPKQSKPAMPKQRNTLMNYFSNKP